MGRPRFFSLGQQLAKFLLYALLLWATVGLAWGSEASDIKNEHKSAYLKGSWEPSRRLLPGVAPGEAGKKEPTSLRRATIYTSRQITRDAADSKEPPPPERKPNAGAASEGGRTQETDVEVVKKMTNGNP